MFKITSLLLFIFLSPLSSAQESSVALNVLLQENKGKVVYIDFWASWCTPCRKSFPWMNKLEKQYKNLKVISINVDSEKSYALEFLQQTPASFSVIYDPKGILAKKYKLKGMPSSFVLNKKGKLVSSHVGFNESKKITYEKELIQLLSE